MRGRRQTARLCGVLGIALVLTIGWVVTPATSEPAAATRVVTPPASTAAPTLVQPRPTAEEPGQTAEGLLAFVGVGRAIDGEKNPAFRVNQGAVAQVTAAWSLIGDATQRGRLIRLTPTEYAEGGAAWLVAKQPVADGFTVSFDLRITRDAAIGGDGIAFVVQNVNDFAALGFHGYGIGYHGITNSLAVEFDTYRNVASEFEGTLDDPNDNHVSVQSRGGWWQNKSDPTYSLADATDMPFLADVQWHTVEIGSAPGTLTVAVDGDAVLTASVDIADYVILDETGESWVGFTAATGEWPQTHDVRNVSFTPAQ
jgi:hypothetical protein